MERKYKIILFILGFFFLFLMVYLVIRGIMPQTQNPQSGQQSAGSGNQDVPPPLTLALNADDESSLRQFVKNFVTLYNNYSYNDFSDLTALGDYENQAMQQKSLDFISQTEPTLQSGYSQSSDPQLSTFSYKTIDLQTFTVTINVNITETNSQNELSLRSSEEPQNYTDSDTLTIVRYGQSWLVADVQINKNNLK